ncbi:Endonuclease-reverse transcriptase [Popillia japonica]|uniref:Endonuclease-reverse transcriptase n=1 Tax=Popillia japonica TaxID=7064 RepID=A0AAW1I986_POPJA
MKAKMWRYCLLARNFRRRIKERKGYVSITIAGWVLFCCYISPNIEMDVYKEKVDEIANQVSSAKKEAIIVGDFNAKSHMWESARNDRKEEHWESGSQRWN